MCRKFESVEEILGRLIDIRQKAENEPVTMYNVILRRTRRKDLVALLTTAGFSAEKARKIAKKVKSSHLIIDTTHLERAELVVSRIQEANDKLKVSIVQA